jgi:exosortase N
MVKKINALMGLPELYSAKPLAWPVLYALLMLAGLGSYLPYDQANFWLGAIAIGLYARYPVSAKGSNRFFIASLAFLLLYYFLPVQTLFFFALVCALLFSLEAVTGKLQAAVIPVVFLMSPVANYAAEVFSFPVRLQLSNGAVKLLQLTGNHAVAHGNTIAFNGTMFDVDQACVGLSMLVSSVLMGIISKQIFEVKYQRRLPLVYLPLIVLYFTIANVLANLFRITILVYFQLAPGTIMHEMAGLATWILYGIIPCMWLVKKMVTHLGLYEKVSPLLAFQTETGKTFYSKQLIMLTLCTLMLGLPSQQAAIQENTSISSASISGFEKASLPHGVTRYRNNDAIIYVKTIRGFYSTDHNPSICWRGSGYAFTMARQVNRGNASMYMANLQKDGSILYTAWWYEHKNHRTNNQMEWRINNLKKNRDYHLVNITASSPLDLRIAIDRWIQQPGLVNSMAK